jgi:hypothetical protein
MIVLPGARVVGKQEAQRLARQHRLVDGRDLMCGSGSTERGVHGEQWVEQVRQPNAVRFGD